MRRVIVSLGVLALLAFTPAAEARKYPPSGTAQMRCYYPDNATATFTWKLDGKKLLKVAIENGCRAPAVFWWRSGRRTTDAIWVEGHSSVDLWKSELKPINRTVSGEIGYGYQGPVDCWDFSRNWWAWRDSLFRRSCGA